MTSYFRRDDVFWLPTVAGAIRERNVVGCPWASLVVSEGDRNEHTMVTIEGPVEVVLPKDAPLDVVDQVEGDWVGCWIKLQAQRVLSYGDDGGSK
jgi:hypothetical protein